MKKIITKTIIIFIINISIALIGTTLNIKASNNNPSLYDQIFNPNMGHRVFLSSLRGPIGILAEHPLDLLKTLQQTQPNMSVRDLSSQIFKESGVLGFYRGVIPTLTMSIIKPSYRLPLIGILPSYFQNKGFSGITPHIQTGAAIASIESCVISPLERIKVWLMTKNNNDINRQNPEIREQIRKNALAVITGQKERIITINNRPLLTTNYLFKGFNFQLATTTCAWTTFMASNYYTKNIILNAAQRNLNMPELILSGIISGIAVTGTALPADFLKTAVQKHESEFTETKKGNQKPNIINATKKLIKQEGFSALYAGWRLKLVGYILRATTINVANYVIDNIMKEK